MAETFQNYIGGEWVDAASGETFESRNPARTSDLIGHFPKSGDEDVARAVEAAKAAFREWSLMPAPKRGEILKRVGDLMTERKSEIARAMTREMGEHFLALQIHGGHPHARFDLVGGFEHAAIAAFEAVGQRVDVLEPARHFFRRTQLGIGTGHRQATQRFAQPGDHVLGAFFRRRVDPDAVRTQIDDQRCALGAGERTRQQLEMGLVLDIGLLAAADLAPFGSLDTFDSIVDFLGQYGVGQHAGDLLMHADGQPVDRVHHGVFALDRRHETVDARGLIAAVGAQRLGEFFIELGGAPGKGFGAEKHTEITYPHSLR